MILPKELDLIAEQEPILRRGDAEIRHAFLPGDRLPAVNSRLPFPELAATMERLAAAGRDGFYRGRTAAMIAAEAGGIASRSIACPPTIPIEPAASAISASTRSLRVINAG